MHCNIVFKLTSTLQQKANTWQYSWKNYLHVGRHILQLYSKIYSIFLIMHFMTHNKGVHLVKERRRKKSVDEEIFIPSFIITVAFNGPVNTVFDVPYWVRGSYVRETKPHYEFLNEYLFPKILNSCNFITVHYIYLVMVYEPSRSNRWQMF